MSHSPLRTSYRRPEESLGLLLWQVTNRWQAEQRAALKRWGLTHVQFVLVASLVWLGSDVPITQRQLTEFAGTDPMMTSQVLRALEQRHLVIRSRHPSDGRAMSIAATDAGSDLVNQAIIDVEACDRLFFGLLGRVEADFTAALATLNRRPAASPQL